MLYTHPHPGVLAFGKASETRVLPDALPWGAAAFCLDSDSVEVRTSC